MTAVEPDYLVSMLARELSELRGEVEQLKRSARSSQLGHSSIDVDKGQGYIPFFKNGVEVLRIGRMPDGTVTTASVNDNVAPAIPLLPVIEAGLGTLTVGCEGLTEGVPFNFRHVAVYIDGMLDGYITRLPGIHIAGPLDPSPHSVRLAAVNQSGTESALTAPIYGTPDMVTERDFEANPILRTEIADGSINTPKLSANAVEAANVAAEAIVAAAIAAGAITADKMEAVMVLANRIIAGASATARRLEISSIGIEQFDELGQLLTSWGANPAGGNFFTIVDPNDTQKAVASLDENGHLTCSGFSINGGATLNGESLSDLLTILPRGLVEWGNCASNTAATTTEIGIMELDLEVDPNRHYRIATNTAFLGLGSGAPADARGETRLRFTTDGTRPTVASTPLEISGVATGRRDALSIDCTFDGARASSGRLRLLYTVASLDGASILATVPDTATNANDLQLWVEDIGPRRSHTGAVSNGGGSSTPPVSNYTKEYLTTWSASYNSASSSELYQGNAGYGLGRSLVGFNDALIRGDLAGATIQSVEVYLYSTHWWYNSGGTVVLGTHNRTGSGRTGNSIGAWPGLNGGATQIAPTFHMNKPEGRWVSLGSAGITLGNQLRDNVVKGLAFSINSDNKDYYGKFQNNTARLRIKYRK